MSKADITPFWYAFGTTAALIFYGRFYVQWIASERAKRSVMPVAFWYMSSVGSVMLFVYSVVIRSPGAAFGQCFNIVVYVRNLVHVWREKGRLTAVIYVTAHLAALAVVLIAVVFLIMTWRTEYNVNARLNQAQAARNWFWLGIWAVGQALFFLRFLIQWLATEIKKKSIVPAAFWYFSVCAALLQSASFLQRADWVNAIGMTATIFIYLRNIWFIHFAQNEKNVAQETA